ncbi:hypothetical protein Q9L58_009435 [Maublancomyces gigas]|uniref:Kinesin light chain n=1 Tax=Discina gigas TaxID=1032678 RepID=A0ABR3G7Y6_9PEZI
MAGLEKALGKQHPLAVTMLDNIANIYYIRGRWGETLGLYEQSYYKQELTGDEKNLGSEHPSTLTALHNTAYFYHMQGRYGKALELYERVLAGEKKILNEELPSTLVALGQIANVYESQALKLFTRIFPGLEKSLVIDRQFTINALTNLADIYRRQGRYEEALKFFERAGQEKFLGKEHPSTVLMVDMIVLDYAEFGRHREARVCSSPTRYSRVREPVNDCPDSHRFPKNSAFLRNRSL